jgi:uncharacterized membrane protein YoaK (UPF0700 family)
MATAQKALPKWILIISALFAIMELGVSLYLSFSPESMAENVDTAARGVDVIIYMIAARQFALGVILAFATYKRSVSMLTLAYLFMVIMFIGDLLIGFYQNNSSIIITAVVMCLISGSMLYAVSQRNKKTVSTDIA